MVDYLEQLWYNSINFIGLIILGLREMTNEG